MYPTADPPARQGDDDLLAAALAYRRRGWSVIPIKVGTKTAAVKWKRYQQSRPSESTIRRWFAGRDDRAVAVVLGPVSGNLVCRDFDTMESYDRWTAAHPDLAGVLPTVATSRGRHVYARAGHDRIVHLEDGELRAGGYCLLPPSRHPDGAVYRWLAPLPDGDLSFLEDLEAAGFLSCPKCNRENRDNGRGQRERRKAQENLGNESIASVAAQTDFLEDDVRQVILETLPKAPGNRHRQVFELARALKTIPRVADAEADALRPYVEAWHRIGVEAGRIATEPVEETVIDFLIAWPKVRFPKGKGPMTTILERARNVGPLPAADRYGQPGLRLLVKLCRELQRTSGEEPFYLGTRTAGRLLGVSHVQAWRWLFLLIHDGVVEKIETGDRARRRASRYRYRGD